MRRVAASLVAVVAAAWLTAALAGEPAKVHIRGKVGRMTPPSEEQKKRGLLLTIMVEGSKEADTSYDRASVKITDKTVIKLKVGKQIEDGKLEDLKEGAIVTAVFTGPVLESYPVQATAKEIVIYTGAK